MKFKIKSGDLVWVSDGKNLREVKVEGFNVFGMITTNYGIIPFSAGRFYGAGYKSYNFRSKRYITVKNKNYLLLALICEILRLWLPVKLGKKIFLI
ncbi:MAG: hypothetical protein AAGE96_17210 [Cyanobacteria bacterium P01_G01_bin.19]